jgi:hypothetical protein
MMTPYDEGMRTIIDLPEDQVKALAHMCAREGISRAEAIRRAVQLLLDERDDEILNEGFGLWADDLRDALEIEDELRAGWERA